MPYQVHKTWWTNDAPNRRLYFDCLSVVIPKTSEICKNFYVLQHISNAYIRSIYGKMANLHISKKSRTFAAEIHKDIFNILVIIKKFTIKNRCKDSKKN